MIKIHALDPRELLEMVNAVTNRSGIPRMPPRRFDTINEQIEWIIEENKIPTIQSDGSRHDCRYVLLRDGRAFASVKDPRDALACEELPEGEYVVGYYCTCLDPENAGMFGRLSVLGAGIAVLRGPKESMWVRED